MTGRNPWAVLCVAEDAPYQEVQRAFRRRVKQTHPDGGGDALEFVHVMQAFDAVRQTLPRSERRTQTRPTPYDPWLRPCGSTGAWMGADGNEPVVVDDSRDIWTTDATPAMESDFRSILLSEMEKAPGLLTLVD